MTSKPSMNFHNMTLKVLLTKKSVCTYVLCLVCNVGMLKHRPQSLFLEFAAKAFFF